MTQLDAATVRRLPKVVLHDHLAGGVRPETLVELAHETGYADLPSTDVAELSQWFADAAHAGSLENYLTRFTPVVDLLQSSVALEHVATEAVLDLAADGVVYAELKIAPEQHTRAGLSTAEVVEAVLAGLNVGRAKARLRGCEIQPQLLLTALRQAAASTEIAELAVSYREAGVVGFDIAGPEAGYPPTRHLAACEHVRQENFNLTIHAGEGFGLSSIWQAIQSCGADRLGHGTRIADDLAVAEDGSAKLGKLAAYVRDKRIPLEMCPTSNVHTGVAPNLAAHPIDDLRRLRFRVTVNTSSRVISQTSMTAEFTELAREFGYGLDELSWFTVNAMKSAFVGHDERLRLINKVIKPAYARARVNHASAAFFRMEDPWPGAAR